jgi:hypothetical protein
MLSEVRSTHPALADRDADLPAYCIHTGVRPGSDPSGARRAGGAWTGSAARSARAVWTTAPTPTSSDARSKWGNAACTCPQSTTMRWEDYTQTAVDPSDDSTIWYVGDYLKKDATTYSTRIGAFRMPGCGSG